MLRKLFSGASQTKVAKTAPRKAAAPSMLRQTYNSYYKEVVYYMHQPQSTGLKFFLLLLWWYPMSLYITHDLKKHGDVYKRKRMRKLDFDKNNLPPLSKQEHELKEELALLTHPR